jgi:hypothetical protein
VQHQHLAKVAEVGDGAGKGGQRELEKGAEDLIRVTGPQFLWLIDLFCDHGLSPDPVGFDGGRPR